MKRLSIIGNLVKDAEVRNLNNGKKAINFTVAVNGKKKNSLDQWEDFATYFKCVYWRDKEQDTKIADYLKKGVKVYAEGDPDIEAYMPHGKTEPAANLKLHVKFIDIAKTAGANQQAASATTQAAAASSNDSSDDDLPF